MNIIAFLRDVCKIYDVPQFWYHHGLIRPVDGGKIPAKFCGGSRDVHPAEIIDRIGKGNYSYVTSKCDTVRIPKQALDDDYRHFDSPNAVNTNALAVFLKHFPAVRPDENHNPSVLVVVDDDSETEVEKLKCREMFGDCPYTKTAKGRHYYMLMELTPGAKGCFNDHLIYTNHVDVFQPHFTGDFFGTKDSENSACNGGHVWEDVTRSVYNWNGKLPVKSFDLLSTDGSIDTSAMNMHTRPDPAAEPEAEEVGYEGPARDIPTPSECKELLDILDAGTYKHKGKEYTAVRHEPDWFEMCCVFKGFGEEYYEIFDEWSQGGAEKYKPHQIRKDWERCHTLAEYEHVKGMPTFKTLLFKYNTAGYQKYLEKDIKQFILSKRRSFTESDGQKVLEMWRGVLFNQSDETCVITGDAKKTAAYVLDHDSGFWKLEPVLNTWVYTICSDEIAPVIDGWIKELDAQVINLYAQEEEEGIDNAKTIKKILQTASFFGSVEKRFKETTFSSLICTSIQLKTANPPRCVKFDSQINMLAFQCGTVYDLYTCKARKVQKQDNLTLTEAFNYDYPKVGKDALFESEEELKTYMQAAYDINESLVATKEECDFMLNIVARMLLGKNLWEYIVFITGGGNNGKSTFTDLLKATFANRCCNMNATYPCTSPGSSNAHDSELVDLLPHLCVFIPEISDAKPLNEAKMKALSGNDDASARKANSPHTVRCKPKFSMIAFCNDIPMFNTSDTGFLRRFISWCFCNNFKDESADNYSKGYDFAWTGYKEIQHLFADPKLRGGYMLLLLEHWKKNVNPCREGFASFHIPDTVVCQTNAQVADKNEMLEFFEKMLVKSPDPACKFYFDKDSDSLWQNWKMFVADNFDKYDKSMTGKKAKSKLLKSMTTYAGKKPNDKVGKFLFWKGWKIAEDESAVCADSDSD